MQTSIDKHANRAGYLTGCAASLMPVLSCLMALLVLPTQYNSDTCVAHMLILTLHSKVLTSC